MMKAQSTCGIEYLLEFRDSSLRYNPATMNLTSGSRLGPYEIVAPLGAGGMGEVFRARDTRLKREVAIKVLPQATSLDPERLRRLPGELSDGKDGAVENLRRRNGRGCYERCSA
jgi:serine/threonine protein kinase